MNGLSLLLALLSTPVGTSPDIAADLTNLKTQYSEAQQAFSKEMQAIKDQKAQMDFYYSKNPIIKYYDLAKELSDRSKGDSAEYDVLSFTYSLMPQALQMKQRPDSPVAYEEMAKQCTALAKDIVSRFPTHPNIATFAQRLGYPIKDPDVQAMLTTLLDKNRGKPSEPTFLYKLGSIYKGWGQPTPENEKKAKALFGELVAKFPDSAPAKEAKGDIFELENLVAGKVFPDFETTDQAGKTWSLKEYRGKVVVLDFWGFW